MKVVLLESLGIPAEELRTYAASLEKYGHEFAACEPTIRTNKLRKPRMQIFSASPICP